MKYPGYAALYVHFGQIQLPCDIAVIQALTQQAIDGEGHPFVPKSSAFRASVLTRVHR